MRKTMVILVAVALVGCVQESAEDVDDTQPEVHRVELDTFERAYEPRPYLSYRSDVTLEPWEGYGIYYEVAEVGLERMVTDQGNSGVRIQLHLPVVHDWGNWLSLRRELIRPFDLSEYDGLGLDIVVQRSENLSLRLSLVDVETAVGSSPGEPWRFDEIWWFDYPHELIAGEEIRLTAPFGEFYRSMGEGARHNDQRLELANIVGYELNWVSKGRAGGEGVFEVVDLWAYKVGRAGEQE